MKKLFKSIVTMGFIIAVCGTMSFVSKAAHGAHGCISAVNRNGFCADYFQDADGDGICDNYGSGRNCANTEHCDGYLDADGDGICDNYGSGRNCANTEHCGGYLDADGDGICDNCGFGHYGQMTFDGTGISVQGSTGVQGSTRGHGHSGKHGHCH